MSSEVQDPHPAPSPAVHWPSAAQFGLSLFAALLLFGGGLLLLVTGVFGALTRPETRDELLPLLLMTASFFSLGLLLIPSVYYGLFHLLGRKPIDSQAILHRLRPGWWLALFPVVLAVGFAASQVREAAWLVLPVLHLFGVGLPIAWMAALAARNLPLGSSQRMWGVFNSGLVLGPAVISILEGLAIGAAALAAGVYIATQPDLLAQVMDLVDGSQFTQPTPDEMLALFSPYLLSPGVIFAALAMGAVVVPLIEEAIKPIGVWLLAGKPLSASAGFAAGALSGAGFALSESLLLSSSGPDWASLVLVRMGTGAIHILTAALTGWALALAWKRRRFGVLALAYLAAVLIHGLWNGLTIATVFAQAAQTTSDSPGMWAGLLWAAPLGLLSLAVGAVTLLAYFNRRLAAARARSRRRSGPPEPVENTPLEV